MENIVNNTNNDQTPPPALPPANNTPTYASLSAGVYALLSSVVELAQEAQVDNFKGVQTGIETRNTSMTYMGQTGLEAAKWAFWGKIAEGTFSLAAGVASIGGSAWNNRASGEIGQLSNEANAIENNLNTLKGNYGEAFNNARRGELVVTDKNPLESVPGSSQAAKLEAAESANGDVNNLMDGIFTTDRSFNANEKDVISDTVRGLTNNEDLTAIKKSYDSQVTDQTTLLGAKRNEINTISQNFNLKLDMAKQALNAVGSFVQAPLNQISSEKQVESQLFSSQENVAGSTLQTAQSVDQALAKEVQDSISMIQSAFSAA